ncbi:MAG: phage terminase large subunit, partial [Burkholderiaceae bacterium]
FIAEISRRNLDKWLDIQKKGIACPLSGGIIKFEGLMRNQQKIKGYANFDCAWVEEAENVSAESWKYLIPTMRKSGSEIWVSFNPDDPLGATYTMFVTKPVYPATMHGKPYSIVKKLNYTENPRFPEELRIDMELMKANDFDMYRHVYLGEPVGNSNLAIIKPAWVEAAVDAHIKLGITATGGKVGGFDVSDEGPDKNAFIHRHGVIVQGVELWRDLDPNTAARHVFNESLRLGLDTVHYDNIGVGAGAKGAIREEVDGLSIKVRPTEFVGFTASASVVDPENLYMPGKKNVDMFLNLKAQAWWLLADRFRMTYDAVNGKEYDPEKIICLPSNLPYLDQLRGELSQPRREFQNGKFRVEPKDKMAKRNVPSPNLADACVMCFSPGVEFSFAGLL